jgi:hypothetical protein
MPQIILKNGIRRNCVGFAVGCTLTALSIMVFVSSTTATWLPLLGAVLFGAGTIMAGVKLLDRAVQLAIDQSGIHDCRFPRKDVPWSEVADIKLDVWRKRGVVQHAHLDIVMKDGSKEEVDLFALEQSPEMIFQNVTAFWNEVAAGADATR